MHAAAAPTSTLALALPALLMLTTPTRTIALPALEPGWRWSWDRIPSWASGQGATDFAPNVTKYYADNFDIMWCVVLPTARPQCQCGWHCGAD